MTCEISPGLEELRTWTISWTFGETSLGLLDNDFNLGSIDGQVD